MVLLSLLMAQLSCFSNSGIKGKVLDSQLKPLEDVEVKFVAYEATDTSMKGGVRAVSKTDENGAFEVPVNDYKESEKLGLVVEKNGYELETISFTKNEIENHKEAFDNYQIILKKNE